MPMELLTHGGHWSMVLDGVVDIFDVAAVHAAAVDAVVGAPEGVTVMLGGVTVIDTAVTQVLLALKAALAEQRSDVRPRRGSPVGSRDLDPRRSRARAHVTPASVRGTRRRTVPGIATAAAASPARGSRARARRGSRRTRSATRGRASVAGTASRLRSSSRARQRAAIWRAPIVAARPTRACAARASLRPLPARGGGLDRIGAARAVPHKCGEEVGQERGVAIGEGA